MFRKLVSNLPFNPSLLGNVSFYARRLKQEESIRRMSFGFMALAMFVQIFAVVAPPQKSLAYSNDYIVNGLNSRDDLLRAWDGQTGDAHVAEIYQKFGLTRDDIAALPLFPNVTLASNKANYWTIGRQSLSAVSKAGKIKQEYKNSEIPINTGSTTVYVRNLKAWDIVNSVNYYKAFEGTKNGKNFWILQNCGNFTTIDVPTIIPEPTPTPIPTPTPTPTPTPEPLPKPAVELRKTIEGGPRILKPGDSYSFRFEYRNTVENSLPVSGADIIDTLDLEHFDIVSFNDKPMDADTLRSLGMLSGNVLRIGITNITYSPNYSTAATLGVKLKTPLKSGMVICNAASLTGNTIPTSTSGGENLCVTVINPCPLDSSVPRDDDALCSNPILVCSLTQASVNRTTKESTLTTTVSSSNPALTKVVKYVYDFGDKSTKTNNSTALTDTVKHVYKDGNYNATATVTYTIGSDTKTTHSVACAASVETKPDQPLSPSKMAENVTQKLDSAKTLTTKANAKDVIEYTLSVHNSFTYDRANYAISDYIGDLLDYTNLDTTFLAQQGGTFDNTTKTISWAGQTVPASGTLTKKFRVTVKDPVPSTNSTVMSTGYDCVISNKYGTEIAIPINCPAAKTAEYIASTLPNTGPGTSIAIGAVITITIGYFFARSRLLGKELDLIRTEYATGGGY